MAFPEISLPSQTRRPDLPLTPQAGALTMGRAVEAQASHLRAEGVDVMAAMCALQEYKMHAIHHSMPVRSYAERRHRLEMILQTDDPTATAPHGETIEEISFLTPPTYLQPLPDRLPEGVAVAARQALLMVVHDEAPGSPRRVEALDILYNDPTRRDSRLIQ